MSSSHFLLFFTNNVKLFLFHICATVKNTHECCYFHRVTIATKEGSRWKRAENAKIPKHKADILAHNKVQSDPTQLLSLLLQDRCVLVSHEHMLVWCKH